MVLVVTGGGWGRGEDEEERCGREEGGREEESSCSILMGGAMLVLEPEPWGGGDRWASAADWEEMEGRAGEETMEMPDSCERGGEGGSIITSWTDIMSVRTKFQLCMVMQTQYKSDQASAKLDLRMYM